MIFRQYIKFKRGQQKGQMIYIYIYKEREREREREREKEREIWR